MKKDEYYMKEALLQAKIAYEEDEIPVGCIIVKDDVIISRAHNTKQKDNNVINHAEINAITKACKYLSSPRLDGCDVYITLEPCTMCASALQQAHVRRIIYGAKELKTGACGSLFDFFQTPKLNHYPYIFDCVLEKECEALLTSYFQNKRR